MTLKTNKTLKSLTILISFLAAIISLIKSFNNSNEISHQRMDFKKQIENVNNKINNFTNIEQNKTNVNIGKDNNGTTINGKGNVTNSTINTSSNSNNNYSLKKENNTYNVKEISNSLFSKKAIREKISGLKEEGLTILKTYEKIELEKYNLGYERISNKWYNKVINYLRDSLDSSYVSEFMGSEIENIGILDNKSVLANPSASPSQNDKKSNSWISYGIKLRIAKLQNLVKEIK